MKTPTRLFSALAFIALAAVTQAQQTAGTPAATNARPSVPMMRTRTNAPAPATASAPKVELIKVGSVAPDFASTDLAGKTVKLSDFKDKVVVVDFWATWCGPCLKSLPHTQEIAKRYKDQGVVVLAACTSDTRAKFEQWMKANAEKYPDIQFASDPNERGSDTFAERASMKLYGVSGIPTQFVVGRDGKVAAATVGYSDGDVRLEAGLAKAGITVAEAKAK